MSSDPTGEVIEAVEWDREFLRLQIDTVGGWFIEVENDFVVTDGKQAFDSRTEADQAVAAIQRYVSAKLEAFDFSESGSLRMSIGDVTLAVEPAYDFEAWHATGPWPEKHMIICQPGGGIA